MSLQVPGIRRGPLLEQAIERLCLSARAWHRVQRVARTIADLEGREAIAYRALDRAPGA